MINTPEHKRLCDFWLKHGLCTNKHKFGKVCDYLDLDHHERQKMWQYLKSNR